MLLSTAFRTFCKLPTVSLSCPAWVSLSSLLCLASACSSSTLSRSLAASAAASSRAQPIDASSCTVVLSCMLSNVWRHFKEIGQTIFLSFGKIVSKRPFPKAEDAEVQPAGGSCLARLTFKCCPRTRHSPKRYLVQVAERGLEPFCLLPAGEEAAGSLPPQGGALRLRLRQAPRQRQNLVFELLHRCLVRGFLRVRCLRKSEHHIGQLH